MVKSQVSNKDQKLRGFNWLLQEIHKRILQNSGASDTAYQERPTFFSDI